MWLLKENSIILIRDRGAIFGLRVPNAELSIGDGGQPATTTIGD